MRKLACGLGAMIACGALLAGSAVADGTDVVVTAFTAADEMGPFPEG